ncbi:MAG: HNH endonuclease [Rhizobiales bacterium]|nr:HNH endonuclease [Hyphomicrobiales bacterium]
MSYSNPLRTLTFDHHRKLAVWAKGNLIPGYDPAIWRRDAFGHAIRFSDYGDRQSDHGWEIDHIVATALGGADDISNLRPLHHTNNSTLGGLLGGLLNPKRD